METRKLDPERCKNRIEFTGKLAPEGIRRKYIGKSVAVLFKFGEANPVKFFPGMEMRDLRGVSKTTSDPEEILKKTNTSNIRDAFLTMIGGAYNEME